MLHRSQGHRIIRVGEVEVTVSVMRPQLLARSVAVAAVAAHARFDSDGLNAKKAPE
jgi:hypothetical protein